MMRGTGGRRRRPKESFKPVPTPTQSEHLRQFGRDSDASFASNRPSSSVGIGRAASSNTFELYKDRSIQQSAFSTINSYLSSHSFAPLKTPLPSAKEITTTLHFLLARLDFPFSKLDEDLPFLLKSLNYPFKFNKSILKSPGTPHQWPAFLALIHWLVQIALFNDYLSSSSPSTPDNDNDEMKAYVLESYLHYIRGDDDAVDSLDGVFVERLERKKEDLRENVGVLGVNVVELEAKAEALRSGPSQKEVLEKDKGLLEEDVNKFHTIISEFSDRTAATEKVLEEKERELEAKVEERKRICEENEELKRRAETQTMSSRDVERMRRELQAMERDIGEAELARNTWDEKSWDLDATLGHKFKELEALAMECNQAMRRLKIGDHFQYVLNAKGSTPAEIMGIDYKSKLKPALDSYADDIQKSSMEKLEDLISLQQLSKENAAKIEEKKNHIVALQSRIDDLEAQLNLLKKEIQDYTYRRAAEAKTMIEEVQREAHDLDVVEREAAEVLKTSKLRLREAINQSEEEIQIRAYDLFTLVDSVSRYKEHVESNISEMKTNLAEAAVAVSDAYKGSLPARFATVLNTNL
ncbi:kinetochore protein NDC80 homolog [Juglans microcarpa x Juglans regia]|uniref:kinetochore protein NDC80 homolog n=1 Tax=Juglans microcarpa x Juglans regia TaxID=2249226 RepID=UPI001B7D9744|nr:kinetochore protein NDC80 homolog [Juglans microcarpa x Juglans regia]